jgi:hypothetical protein
MITSKEHLESLKQKIKVAFADVPYPKGVLAPHECDECREVRRTFLNKNWKTIEPKILEENFGIVPLFSPEAFRYFLPAYLIYSLEHFSEKYDTVCEFTIYGVSPSKEAIETRLDYLQQRFKNFTSEQMSCIYEFLNYVRNDENFESFSEEAKQAEELIREFVDPVLRKKNYEGSGSHT